MLHIGLLVSALTKTWWMQDLYIYISVCDYGDVIHKYVCEIFITKSAVYTHNCVLLELLLTLSGTCVFLLFLSCILVKLSVFVNYLFK